MSIQIIPFSDEFTEGVRDLIVPIQQDEFGIPITYLEQPDLRDIPGFYQQGGGGFWIALDEGTVVGSVALLDIGTRQGALRKMFVKRAYRGAEQGVAQRLLEGLFRHATEKGLVEIYLGTTSKFLAAHRFYEKSGFDLVEVADLPEAFPRMAVDTRFYVWRIATTASPA